MYFLRNRSQEEDITIAWNVKYSCLLSKRRTPICMENGVGKVAHDPSRLPSDFTGG